MVKRENTICFVSSYPPNRGRLSEYAEVFVRNLGTHSSISKLIVIADIAKNAPKKEQKGRIHIWRIWQRARVNVVLKRLKDQVSSS